MGQRRVHGQVMRRAYLDDEDVNRVLRVVNGGIGTLEDAPLTGCSGYHGESRLRKRYVLGSEMQCSTLATTREKNGREQSPREVEVVMRRDESISTPHAA